jgi:UDP-N-acetylglucosamine 1-carboxyvinyltransferase
MAHFVVEGPCKLAGEITPSGNKNAALPMLAATLLASGPVTLHNLPLIGDVKTVVQILEGLGCTVSWLGARSVRIDPSTLTSTEPPTDLARRIRGSALLAGPLLTRCGRATLPYPGGDRIGRRRMDTHLMALGALGARVTLRGTKWTVSCGHRLIGSDLLLDEASVTGTENTIMAAACAEGRTSIFNAAGEPHVQALCRMLNNMGAKIRGIGTNRLEIDGVPSLGGSEFIIPSDYIEIGSFIALAAASGSQITIRNAAPDDMKMILMVFRRLSIEVEIDGPDIRVPVHEKLVVRSDLRGAVPKIDDAPWPGFPADLTSIALVTATQAHGTLIVFEKMFESRLFFVDRLIEMGARIILCDPHRAVVVGPSPLHGTRMASPDIRAGMALLIAALCAEGRSEIHNIEQIDRGYEAIDPRLNALGANIRRFDD